MCQYQRNTCSKYIYYTGYRLKCPPVPTDGVSHCADMCEFTGCKIGYLCCSISCGRDCRKGIGIYG